MCGIFGIWQQDGQPIELALLQSATTALRHRGPDDEGYVLISTQSGQAMACGGPDSDPRLDLPHITQFFGKPFNMAFGFRRLAILDLSPAGHQPMSSPDGHLWIVFNGEIYNYLELRAELADYGYEFQSSTDTEVILAAYQQWGAECLSRFNGMWAFAIWDRQAQQLFVARDRFGIKPLYYLHNNHIFAFASEIKALVGRQKLLSFESDERAIYRYLVSGHLPSPQRGQTFFKDIKSLPPGRWLLVGPETVRQRRYWNLPVSAAGSPNGRATDVIEQYRELFIDSVRLRLRADVPVGTCLSGGIDSSAIVCVVNQLKAREGLAAIQLGKQQKTFSAIYNTAGPYNERPYVERIVQATNVEDNFTVPSVKRLRSDLERFVWHQEEPFTSTSMFAQWCVMELAHKRGVTVLLDGQGADEVLAGYRPFARFLGDLLGQGWLGLALTEARAIQTNTGIAISTLLTQAITRRLWANIGSNLWLRRWVEPLWRRRINQRVTLAGLNRDFIARQQHPDSPVDWQVENEQSSLASYLGYTVEESSLPHLLRYEDRNSMAFGLEGRVPFLDYRLIQFSFETALPWCIHQGWTKWILRQAMDGLVPPEITWRKDKVAFATPQTSWLGEWLQAEPDFFGDGVFSNVFLDLGAAQAKLKLWLGSNGPVPPVWRWINLEQWLRVWYSA